MSPRISVSASGTTHPSSGTRSRPTPRRAARISPPPPSRPPPPRLPPLPSHPRVGAAPRTHRPPARGPPRRPPQRELRPELREPPPRRPGCAAPLEVDGQGGGPPELVLPGREQRVLPLAGLDPETHLGARLRPRDRPARHPGQLVLRDAGQDRAARGHARRRLAVVRRRVHQVLRVADHELLERLHVLDVGKGAAGGP